VISVTRSETTCFCKFCNAVSNHSQQSIYFVETKE
jgi:hypothetical protein